MLRIRHESHVRNERHSAIMLFLFASCLLGISDLDAQEDRLQFSSTTQDALYSPVSALPVPAAAGDVLNSVGGVTGGIPLGIAVVGLGGNQRIYVVDLFSGFTEAYDLALNALGITIPNPGGTSTHTGIAWNGDAAELYWVDVAAALVHVTNFAGDPIGDFPLPNPSGGTVGGLTYDDVSGTLWAVDTANDIYFEFTTAGVLTGSQFDHPLGVGFGNGISHLSGTGLFDIPVGSLNDGQVVEVIRQDSLGNALLSFSVTDTLDTFVNGNAHHPTGSTGVEVNYVVGNATNTIFEIETGAGPCLHEPISGFLCSFDASTGTVTATWVNNDTYDGIVALRDGVPIDNPPAASDTTFTDTPPPGLSYSYTVSSSVGAESCAGGTCNVTAVTPCDLVFASTADEAYFGITVIETEDTVVATRLFAGTCPRFDRELNFIGEIPSPGGINTTTGIAWDPATENLFWIDVTAQVLYETNTNGVIQNSFPLDVPAGGLPGGMDLLVDGTGLIVNDIVADNYVAVGFDGTLVDPGLFQNPGVFGNGVARLPSSATTTGYEIPTGDTASGQVTSLVTVDESGAPVGCEFPVGNPDVFVNDIFVNGVALSNTGPAGCALIGRYVVGNATNSIFSTGYSCDPSPPGEEFIRGDANGDGTFNALVDGLFSLNFGFVPGSPQPPCLAQADANGDDTYNSLVDALFTLNFGFVPGSPAIPAPFPDCGTDDDTVAALGCDLSACP